MLLKILRTMPRIIPSAKKQKGVAGRSLGDVLSEEETKAAQTRAAAPFLPFGRDDDILQSRTIDERDGNNISRLEEQKPPSTTSSPQVGRRKKRRASLLRNTKTTTTATITTNEANPVDPVWVLSGSSAEDGAENISNMKSLSLHTTPTGEKALARISKTKKIGDNKDQVGQMTVGDIDSGTPDRVRPGEQRTQQQSSVPCKNCEILQRDLDELKSGNEEEPKSKETSTSPNRFCPGDEKTGQDHASPWKDCDSLQKQLDELKGKHEEEIKAKETLFEERQNQLNDRIASLQSAKNQIESRLLALFPKQQQREQRQTERGVDSLDLVLALAEKAILSQQGRIRGLEATCAQANLDLENERSKSKGLVEQLARQEEQLRLNQQQKSKTENEMNLLVEQLARQQEQLHSNQQQKSKTEKERNMPLDESDNSCSEAQDASSTWRKRRRDDDDVVVKEDELLHERRTHERTGLVSVLENLEKRHGNSSSSDTSDSGTVQSIEQKQPRVEYATRTETETKTSATSRPMGALYDLQRRATMTAYASNPSRPKRLCTLTKRADRGAQERPNVCLTKVNNIKGNNINQSLCPRTRSSSRVCSTRATRAHAKFHANIQIPSTTSKTTSSVATRIGPRPNRQSARRRQRSVDSLFAESNSTSNSSICSI